MPRLKNARHGFYVYTLTDARNGEVFYVGKGSGDRDKSHIRDARSWCGVNPFKTRRILEIEAEGAGVKIDRIVTGLTESQAFSREREEIDKIGIENLTNIKPGQRSDDERALLQIEQGLAQLAGRVASAFNGVPTTQEQWAVAFGVIRELREMRVNILSGMANTGTERLDNDPNSEATTVC
ncbi:hypothetical protein MXMO3_01802 [Maritalea myrionectae]|uniref:GIY-YIG domain-containing protein n=1 Tax=Maritalea myrionectae TaxID=454601 RepID=A0A2R4ME64_9HYPH|nr:GIY-YIG nuclease family protein [Maritalea myrionectae]AVX04327.1 hypothetical protein MXMO3_01802 [Maritalea myrionectae]